MTNSDNENEIGDQNAVQLNLLTNSLKETHKISDDNQIKRDKTAIDDKNELQAIMREMSLTADTTCGYGFCRFKFLQSFANQTTYVIIYGIVGCVLAAAAAYFNGTITTLEKRFKIPSKNIGIISVGNDISILILSAILSYYGGKGHRPRWISFGLLTLISYYLMIVAPHFIYGPGEDALLLTEEYDVENAQNSTSSIMQNLQHTKSLCHTDGEKTTCRSSEGNFTPQIIFFVAKFISGIGSSIYYTLGVAYMDDNAKKSETPMLISFSFFLKFLGPPIGFAMASFCLNHYISPDLHPTITTADQRWLGAWWIGWLIFAIVLFILTLLYVLFPKELPQAVARRRLAAKRQEEEKLLGMKNENNETEELKDPQNSTKASFKDMCETYKRLFRNKLFVLNTLDSIFFLFGSLPYWIYSPKYIETQYRQSAAVSNMVTGSVALVFTAIGILASGFVISRTKPSARSMAIWNTLVNFVTVSGMIAYTFIGCAENERGMIVNIYDANALNATPTCNSACACDYVRYSPICGENKMTYISPCHAGCKEYKFDENGKIIYSDCECIPPLIVSEKGPRIKGGSASSGSCVVNCFTQFTSFLAIMCCLKFFGASGRATNFLLSARCVEERDKTASFGVAMMAVAIFAFMPSPIFFGWIFDHVCLVWGKTCTNKGNCWLYDSEALRYAMNLTAAAFVSMSVVLEIVIWYYAKDLKVFDEKENENENDKDDKIKRTFSKESVNAERI